jgi:hypothetical protein
MASISKFSTALLSVPNEITVAAANLNINFSLMKVEAPKEFHGLRDGLSSIRRHEAEEGLTHITARTLGALFESTIPPIPSLTVAYGKRVSEISQNLEGGTSYNLHAGMFADRAGPDGTSIWAAATSGQSAIAMHLLSCMLARFWKPFEATSLWVELVERRKHEIQQTFGAHNAEGTAAIMAAQQPFTREQLSTWDSSARSWLQSADAIKRTQQTQLILIINNVRMPVNLSKDPYKSVIKAWKSAMYAMERLLQGVPQRVQDGAILLAISAWHLYPVMHVLSENTIDVDQKDDLMTGSLLTISSYGASDAKDGVYWSLPLSRMQYYSPPVMAERHLASDTSRVSMEEFQIVFLGAFIAQSSRICLDEERCCRLIVRIEKHYRKAGKDPPSRLEILANTASRIVESNGPLRTQYLKLLKLGSRRYEQFLKDPCHKLPLFFGLEHFHVLVQSLGDIEDRIKLLRRAAEIRNLDHNNTIIRYKTERSFRGDEVYELASAMPFPRSSRKRSIGQCETFSTGHRRFAFGHCFQSSTTCNVEGVPCSCIDSLGPKCICKGANTRCTDTCYPGATCTYDLPLPFEYEFNCDGKGTCAGCCNRKKQPSIASESEEFFLLQPDSFELESSSFELESDSFEVFDQSQFLLKLPEEERMAPYGLMLGDDNIAALYKTNSHIAYDLHDTYNDATYTHSFTDAIFATMDEIEAALELGSFSLGKFNLQYDTFNIGSEQQMCSLEALAFASALYSPLKGATVSLEVMKTPIYNVSWASMPHSGTKHLTDVGSLGRGLVASCGDPSTNAILSPATCWFNPARETRSPSSGMESFLLKSFACLAWFESGEFNIALDKLRGVMALANGDSIYVASVLLADPATGAKKIAIQRVFGNLGRSEMSLLIPPSSPRLSEPDPGSWNLINHADFDGRFQNCFASTSLHLTFTDFKISLDVGARGYIDRQVVLLETLVSIDDRGKNLGDLDILSAIESDRFSVMRKCSHSESQTLEPLRKDGLISLDSWDEFLDPPRSIAIFRASGNWQARLAAATAAIQAGKRIVVLPETPCLKCVDDCNDIANIDMIIA